MQRRGIRLSARKVRAVKTLQLEQLESRQFLSGSTSASLVSPGWFADYTAASQARHAGESQLTSASVTTAGNAAARQSDVCDWIVQFKAASLGRTNSAAGTLRLLTGGRVHFDVLRGLGITGDVLVRSSGASAGQAAAWLKADRHVATFEMDSVRQCQAVPNDPQYQQLWGLQNTGQTGGVSGADINAPAAWSISTGSRSVVVAVIDTGVDYTHSDLAANIWTNSREIAGNGVDDDGNGYVDDLHGYNFAGNNSSPLDDNGHGTHVAGTIGAVGNNGLGMSGVNWAVSIMPLKFLDAEGSGYTSDAVRAVNYVTMMRTRYNVNVRVVNASWVGAGADTALNNAIRAAGDAGILFVSAAGNSATNNDASPQYPANYELPNVLSVAATDRNDRLASFSDYGASTVDLAAPGVGIYSTVPGGYASYSGTSMATPHVAGVAALAWAAAPNATVAQVRSAILQGVDPIASLAGKVATGGRLDAYNTLRLISQTATPVTPVTPVQPTVPTNPALAAATRLTVGSVTYGEINPATDVDWFKFQAVAGRSYVISTGLGTLPDSVLTLYDQDGQRALAFNDDVSASSRASQITWTAPASGTYYATVVSYGNVSTGNYSIQVAAGNTPPSLAVIANQVVRPGGSLSISLGGGDADGDGLVYGAQAYTADPLSQRAYDLRQQLGLYRSTQIADNARGWGERYFGSASGAIYFLTPSGTLCQLVTNNIKQSVAIAQFTAAYYADPGLLITAPLTGLAQVSPAAVGMTVSGNKLTIAPPANISGSFVVQAYVFDGQTISVQNFIVTASNTVLASRAAAKAVDAVFGMGN